MGIGRQKLEDLHTKQLHSVALQLVSPYGSSAPTARLTHSTEKLSSLPHDELCPREKFRRMLGRTLTHSIPTGSSVDGRSSELSKH